jgi:hypothetical protein
MDGQGSYTWRTEVRTYLFKLIYTSMQEKEVARENLHRVRR